MGVTHKFFDWNGNVFQKLLSLWKVYNFLLLLKIKAHSTGLYCCNIFGKSFHNTLTSKQYLLNYGRNSFLTLDNAVYRAAKNKLFHPFLTRTDSLPWKVQITQPNNVHHNKAVIKTTLWACGFGVIIFQLLGNKIKQRCGRQIRVITWTGSYPGKSYYLLFHKFYYDIYKKKNIG